MSFARTPGRPKGYSPRETKLEALDLLTQTSIKLDKLHSLCSLIQNEYEKLNTEVGRLRKENTEFCRELKKAVSLIFRLVDDPESQHHAKAVMNDHFFNRPERPNAL